MTILYESVPANMPTFELTICMRDKDTEPIVNFTRLTEDNDDIQEIMYKLVAAIIDGNINEVMLDIVRTWYVEADREDEFIEMMQNIVNKFEKQQSNKLNPRTVFNLKAISSMLENHHDE